ncbi:MAG: LysR family transcriptional regulator [Burkholderiaceae bacterium]|jgi:DNA-binding transcriptional LysR family regulator|nr:LysR family transcriptional regulator [Burkholderiaceae bacterium]
MNKAHSQPRDVLTPDALGMLAQVARAGSFAAAARQMNLAASSLTYRVRQIEDALDVLLFDRGSRQARPTAAGRVLLQESERLLTDIDAVAGRVRHIATGWEPQLTVMADGALSTQTLLDLAEAFYALGAPTRLKLTEGILSGPMDALAAGQADLTLGTATTLERRGGHLSGVQWRALGHLRFVFVVAPHHPLALAAEPIDESVLRAHRVVAVADTGMRDPLSYGLLGGQEVLSVPSLQIKMQAQLRGLGCGWLPEPLVRQSLRAGLLIARRVAQPEHKLPMFAAWGGAQRGQPGLALQWWLGQLASPVTQAALLGERPAV